MREKVKVKENVKEKVREKAREKVREKMRKKVKKKVRESELRQEEQIWDQAMNRRIDRYAARSVISISPCLPWAAAADELSSARGPFARHVGVIKGAGLYPWVGTETPLVYSAAEEAVKKGTDGRRPREGGILLTSFLPSGRRTN